MRREESHLNHNSALRRFRQKITIPRKKRWIPSFQIKLVPTASVSWGVASRPGSQITARRGRQIVPQNPKRFRGDFHIRSAEKTRVVQAIRLQSREVAVKVEVRIQD